MKRELKRFGRSRFDAQNFKPSQTFILLLFFFFFEIKFILNEEITRYWSAIE